MRRAPATLLPIALVLPLVACAGAKDYPSLERRAAERPSATRTGGSADVVTPEAPPAPPPPLSPELATRLGQLVDQARAAHQRFGAKRAAAERLVGAGTGAPGSESWSVATVALSDLESARSDAMVALAELDELFAGESIAAAETGDPTKVSAVAAARNQVTVLIDEEDGILAALRGRVRD